VERPGVDRGATGGLLRSVVPTALRPTPFAQVDLSVEIQSDQASFLCHDDGSLHCLPRQGFLVNGSFPQAAA
jgi:hypothetical protein